MHVFHISSIHLTFSNKNGTNSFYNSKTAKTDSSFTNALFLLFLIFWCIIIINIRKGGSKVQRFSTLFFLNFLNNNVGESIINRSIIKKGKIVLVSSGIDFANTPCLYSNRATI